MALHTGFIFNPAGRGHPRSLPGVQETRGTLLLDLMLTQWPEQGNTFPSGLEAGRHLWGELGMPKNAHVNSYARNKVSACMLRRVTATRQRVSTRCDLWWENKMVRSLLPVFSRVSMTPGVSNPLVQPSCRSSPCEGGCVGGEYLYYWKILCDVINCGTVATIWYCDQNNP